MRRLSLLLVLMLMISGAAYATTGWTSQTSPTSEVLTDVFTLSPSTAVAVAWNQTIIKTSDHGQTWALKTTPNINNHFNAVHFPSSLTGYAVGTNTTTNQLAFKTTDGGETWANITFVTTPDATIDGLRDVFFTSDSVGWVVGQHNVATCVYKTVDGGNNWSNSFAGGIATGITYYGVYFLDANTGWVVGASGDTIYKTTNGGTTNWTAHITGLPASDTLYDVFFLDANNGWAVGSPHDFGVGNTRGLVLRTTNGGSSWSLINSGREESLTAVRFIDANNGWAVCKGNNTGAIIKTTDGGLTWTEESTGSPGELYGLSLADSFSGWAVGGKTPPTGEIYRFSTDPTITSINPSTTNQGQTLVVTLEGTNFLTGVTTSSVTFSLSGITVNTLTRDSGTKLTLNITVAGAASTGLGNITLTNPDGGSVTEINAFSVNPFGVTPPTITSITPAAGGQNATLVATLEGANFLASPTVSFNNSGVVVNSQTNDATSITMNITISATAAPTWRTVSVTNFDSGVSSKNNFFKVNNGPTVTSLTEIASSPAASGTGFTGASGNYYVTGTYFQSGAAASFSPAGVTVNSVEFVDSAHLKINITVAGGATVGNYSLTITNPDGGNGSGSNLLSVSQTPAQAGSDNNKNWPFPNPWNPLSGPLTMQFYLTKATQVKIALFTIGGEKLTEFIVNAAAGYNKITWDGTTYSGHVPAGAFLANIIDLAQNKTIGRIKVMVHYRP
ncbi:MAG: hypothetical protein KJ771_09050 [Nanoarchaeota archaeon]|nr:hypothetical protein [Nanoarchaeota archaeon]